MKERSWARGAWVLGITLPGVLIPLLGMAATSGDRGNSGPLTGVSGAFLDWFIIGFAWIGLFVYLMPFWYGFMWKAPNLGTIFFVNLFLGWTGIAWLLLVLYIQFLPRADRIGFQKHEYVLLSPDGRNWWDGRSWRPVG
jgi:hypothetical protein